MTPIITTTTIITSRVTCAFECVNLAIAFCHRCCAVKIRTDETPVQQEYITMTLNNKKTKTMSLVKTVTQKYAW